MDWIDELFSDYEKGYYTDDSLKDWLITLVNNASISDEERCGIEDECCEKMSWERYSEIKIYLLNNQIDPVLSANNYNQTDIVKHLNKFT